MEKNDLAMIKAENDRLVNDIEKLKQRLREEITRTQAGVRLDLNLEKGRYRDESSGKELKLKEVEYKIEQEIAGLRTAIQASKVRHTEFKILAPYPLTDRSVGDHLAVSRWNWCVDFQPIFRPFRLLNNFAVTGCSALLMAYLRFRAWRPPRWLVRLHRKGTFITRLNPRKLHAGSRYRSGATLAPSSLGPLLQFGPYTIDQS